MESGGGDKSRAKGPSKRLWWLLRREKREERGSCGDGERVDAGGISSAREGETGSGLSLCPACIPELWDCTRVHQAMPDAAVDEPLGSPREAPPSKVGKRGWRF